MTLDQKVIEGQRVVVLPGWHKCHSDPSQDYGIGSPEIIFVLTDGGWAIALRVLTGWGLPKEWFHAQCPSCKHPMHQNGFPLPNGPTVDRLTIHSPVARPGALENQGACEWIHQQSCWVDGSYGAGDEAFALLCTEGADALFGWMQNVLNAERLAVQ